MFQIHPFVKGKHISEDDFNSYHLNFKTKCLNWYFYHNPFGMGRSGNSNVLLKHTSGQNAQSLDFILVLGHLSLSFSSLGEA